MKQFLHVPTGDPQAKALEAGSLNFNGPRQIYCPPPILLGPQPAAEAIALSAHVRVPTPDSRCRVKLSVVFYPSSGAVPGGLAGVGTIWLAAYEEDQGGAGGGNGRTVPVANVEGTSAAPTSFPATAGLAGYSREFVTAADYVEAEILINGSGAANGNWVVQTRIQPDGVTLMWKEWEEIRRLFLPQRSS